MPEDPDWERHWNTICLGIITIATAAIGGALFAADYSATNTSWIEYALTIIAIWTYLLVLLSGADVIFTSEISFQLRGTSKRSRARILYGWFFTEIFALAGLLISDAFASLLQSFGPAS